MHFSNTSADESIHEDTPVTAIVIPQPPPEQINAPDAQKVLADAQKLASMLASPANPFLVRPPGK